MKNAAKQDEVSKSELIERLGCNDNERLARWQGNLDFSKYTLILQTATGCWPDYINDDAAAMSLLDTLVERGYGWDLKTHFCITGLPLRYMFLVTPPSSHYPNENTICGTANTRREAVVAAVLALISKEP